ncbi:LysR family transcriptional regulator [Caminibacter pacificus]|uniref:DNA-binding transcriptional LysR family regulator n=1 Tax=Caminibacter pacificus TaxID=1424653 RepID=A0AAJ4RCU5_9BACT|nr:LysR family transcriptional regulator [Caminibacter pacificus]NPA88210.1 LysR family transcriptional regulator [Campylobacterota bacterium]QDD68096.1 LysR family transcriptional regulator [Caminibacter pacificus]ROR39997.1 DNA-binding transcriptional LysR family regulator [Caminibacter pacificus]
MVIKYLDKIYTFLVINKEASFSKASKILGISQPAVTQQIRILENFLGVTLFERKKNGVILTKDGQNFLTIAKEFEKFLEDFENKIDKFKNLDSPFLIGASPTVGNYNLPECIKYYKTLINKEINLIIKSNDALFEDVANSAIDMAFVTKKKKNGLNYVEWIEDELVVFSNKPLPSTIELEDLKNYKMICREPNSSTREFIKNVFEAQEFECDTLNIISLVHNSTALKYTVMNANDQVVSIISKMVIKEELRDKKLFAAKIKGMNLKRKTYVVYKEKTKDIEAILNFIKS